MHALWGDDCYSAVQQACKYHIKCKIENPLTQGFNYFIWNVGKGFAVKKRGQWGSQTMDTGVKGCYFS